MVSESKIFQYEICGHSKNWIAMTFYGCSGYLEGLPFSDKFAPGFTRSSEPGLVNCKEDAYY